MEHTRNLASEEDYSLRVVRPHAIVTIMEMDLAHRSLG